MASLSAVPSIGRARFDIDIKCDWWNDKNDDDERNCSYLLLFPDVVVDGDLASLSLLPPPLLCLLTDVTQLVIGQLEVKGHEEDLLVAVETQVDVQQAAIVVESTMVESWSVNWSHRRLNKHINVALTDFMVS